LAVAAERQTRLDRSMTPKMRDGEVRAAAISRLFAHALSCPNTLVVEELGLAHGASRVDIAVINGHIRGVEIKAEADTLARLPGQVAAYGAVVDRATLIVAERHLASSIDVIGPWWGVLVAGRAANGAVTFRRIRGERANPGADPAAQASLLWRSEAVAILSELGCESKVLRAPRAALYAELARRLPRHRLATEVRRRLKARKAWRDQPRPL
jgi:hypothetical protein